MEESSSKELTASVMARPAISPVPMPWPTTNDSHHMCGNAAPHLQCFGQFPAPPHPVSARGVFYVVWEGGREPPGKSGAGST
eukprot:836019-Alexandrium_andersonii.AAC.1